ncbi:hypothetical protein [Anaplasma phagocytophilum]|uniref:hypothetical protein n=1 Tax=Anaplasma phagocytophilum TaxID=948 RepID=UPI00187C2DE4|nr:hypothetical protein [Anaplasma phagocytophilum]
MILGPYLGNNPDTRKSGNSHRNCILCTGNLIAISVTVKFAMHSRGSKIALR